MNLFSVIIPHYNSACLLKHLLDSIPVDNSVQLIVVDDKSTEDIAEVEYLVTARGGLFLHNTTAKKGAGTCRNLGLEKATGKWLIFADADDYFLEGAFDILRRHADSEADIIYFIPTSLDMNTGKSSTRHTWCEKLIRRFLTDPTEENEMVLRYRSIVPWSKMIRRRMVEDAGILFDEVIVSNDIMFSVKCGHYARKIEACTEKIYCVTKSQNTLTTKHDEAAFRVRATLYKDRYSFLKEHVDLTKSTYVMPMGARFLLHAAEQGYSAKFIYETYRYFRRERVPLINFGDFRYALLHNFKERGVYRNERH